jgi:hypothetical protein
LFHVSGLFGGHFVTPSYKPVIIDIPSEEWKRGRKNRKEREDVPPPCHNQLTVSSNDCIYTHRISDAKLTVCERYGQI